MYILELIILIIELMSMKYKFKSIHLGRIGIYQLDLFVLSSKNYSIPICMIMRRRANELWGTI